ncbi:MAG: 6-bladed beta-propeller [Phycisphaerales bacterium]|nr:MAG: 6-bladed beta-propeller [Phycisphaerales bacterium]
MRKWCRTTMHGMWTKRSVLNLIFLLLCCGGCIAPRDEVLPATRTAIVWPSPPEPGRIRHIGVISTQEDLKRRSSWSQGLGELFFGKRKIGVLRAPSAVAIRADGRLFVADSAGGVVHVFNLLTRKYNQFTFLDRDGTLQMPVALALIDSNVYVVDSVLHKVCVFDNNGKFRFSFGSERLKRPSGIAYSPLDGKIYVVDTGGHTLNVFDKNGGFLGQIGSRGVEPGRFNFPTHLWIDGEGKLYVSDTLNYRVQILSRDGRFLKMFGEHGDRPGYFAHPFGIATDSLGHIYVADRQFENIQVFDSDGRILMAFGKEGSDVGEFWLPAGLYIDERNRIYVADSFNKRIQVFELLEVPGDE